MIERDAFFDSARRWLLLGLCLVVASGLVWRAVYLQWVERVFLQDQGDARHLRTMELAADRGVITDRNGEPLAMSTPVDSVWVHPKTFLENVASREMLGLAKTLGMKPAELQERVSQRADKEFVYLKRHVSPELAGKVKSLGLAGVSLQREYRRYYPMAEVTGHVVGFTNVDDEGQEGIELAFNEQLRGTKGEKRVLKDRLGDVVEDVESITNPQPGQDVVLSLDRRLQYLAYRELKATVQTHRASSASAVILDVKTGEVLAMVNQPSFNPNNRASFDSRRYRNRAVTDIFEPGSTVKPFTVAAALAASKVTPRTVINTSPGRFRIGNNTIHDSGDYGAIDVTTILQKSSNVGASKIALSITPEQLWRMFDRVGFGLGTGSRFPGEVNGLIGDYWQWSNVQQASRSYGYGMSVSTLQLARAYSVLANDGVMKPISFLKLNQEPEGEVVMPEKVAAQVRTMLESVVADKGTGTLARVEGYRVAGKTGTVHKTGRGGYAEDRYISLFAGIAPASKPRLAMVIVIHDPQVGDYYGGLVAAPVFSKVMAGALRLMNVPPDDLKSLDLRQASLKNKSANDGRFLRTTVGGLR